MDSLFPLFEERDDPQNEASNVIDFSIAKNARSARSPKVSSANIERQPFNPPRVHASIECLPRHTFQDESNFLRIARLTRRAFEEPDSDIRRELIESIDYLINLETSNRSLIELSLIRDIGDLATSMQERIKKYGLRKCGDKKTVRKDRHIVALVVRLKRYLAITGAS